MAQQPFDSHVEVGVDDHFGVEKRNFKITSKRGGTYRRRLGQKLFANCDRTQQLGATFHRIMTSC